MSPDDLPVHDAQYRVQGMTCQHCVNAVTAEVVAVPGVTGAHVALSSGLLQVTSASAVPRSEVAAAVDEAGYVLLDA